MRGNNLPKSSQLVLPVFLQAEGVCFPHPPTPRMPLSPGSAHRDDNSYFSLQEQASHLFLRVSTSWEESPRGRSFNCPPSGFALGWGNANALCPLCANGARGADGNLCGVAVRSVDIWGQVALLLCLRKDSVQRGHLAFSMQQQYFPSGGSPGGPRCVHCLGTTQRSAFPPSDSSFFPPWPQGSDSNLGQKTMESARAALERP